MIVSWFNRDAEGFTLLEVLVLIVIVFVLITLSIPTKDRSSKPTIASCMDNQRQIALGVTMWNAEHQNVFPWRVAADKGGTLELAVNGDASQHFQLLSNYHRKPAYLICSSDKARSEATSFAALANSNLSYFVNLDAATNNGQIILTGDRHLQVNGQPVKPGLLAPGPNAAIEWTRELHAKSAPVPLGILSFTDGHVEVVKEKLTSYFQRQNQITNRLAIP